MTTPPNPALDNLLKDHGLTAESRLYREALFSSLKETGTPGVFHLDSNPNPSDTVVDVYDQGYVVQASEVGPGLSFAETATPNWQETMELRAVRAGHGPGVVPEPHVEVEVRLGDVLAQGGLLYQVESVTVEHAWYCTLPQGGIDVRIVQ